MARISPPTLCATKTEVNLAHISSKDGSSLAANPPAVVYLNRDSVAPQFATAFLHSILRDQSPDAFDLVVLMKGVCSNVNAIRTVCAQYGFAPRLIAVSDDLFDLSAYMAAAELLPHKNLLLFNSYARALSSNWFSCFCNGFAQLGSGALLGATGSFETHGNVPPFPNAHVRTNAFMLSRELLLSFNDVPLLTKRDCNRFEAGQNGLTKRILRSGGQVGIIGRDGVVYRPDAWPQAQIFRSGAQENLLVADNRTQDYRTASIFRRRKLASLAWGSAEEVTGDNIITRLLSRRAWARGDQLL